MESELLERLDPRHYEQVARLLLPDPVVAWVTAGSGPPSAAEAAFARRRLRPRVLSGTPPPDTATTLLGRSAAMPIGIAPIGLMGSLHPDGERGTVRGAGAAGAIHVVGVNSTTEIEDVVAAAPDAGVWLQLYNWPDRDALAEVVRRAEAAGCRAIVPLVNTPVPAAHVPPSAGFRLPAGMSLAHGAAAHGLAAGLDPEYLGWLRTVTSLPIVAKGVMHPDDARRVVDAGAAGVWVSNHGDRQLPRAMAPIDALPDVAAAVGDRAEVYLDGGVRSGADVLVALAAGARAVFVGRPACWALAVGGADGIERMLRQLRDELVEAAALCGIGDLGALPPDLVTAG